jgi:SAM-dependent methyltransferase
LTLEEFSVANPALDFDVICFFHVLEHVPDPCAFLRAVATKLRPGGKIVFSVPHPERLILLAARESADYPPNHLTRFSIQGLRLLAARSGLRVLDLRDHPRDVGLTAFISLSLFGVLRRWGVEWPYGSRIPRLWRAAFKLPFFAALSPFAAVRYFANRRRPGSALYLICEKTG